MESASSDTEPAVHDAPNSTANMSAFSARETHRILRYAGSSPGRGGLAQQESDIGPLYLNPRAQLDHGVIRQLEEFDDAARVARHRGEEPLAPVRHAGPAHGHDRLAAHEVAGLEGIDQQAVRGAQGQRARNVGRVLEAVVDPHLPEAAHEL